MHELSIAHSLVNAAEEAAKNAGVSRVDVVHLKLGELSGVVADALLFGYDVATNGTLLEGSRLEIENIPVVVYCPVCNADAELPNIQLFQCPTCGTPTHMIRQGRELELVSLEILDDDEQPERTTHS